MAVLTLTVKDERLREVEEFAKEEERSREELVDEAIGLYLREKAMDRLRTEGCTPRAMEMARKYLTEEDFSAFVEEVIHEIKYHAFAGTQKMKNTSNAPSPPKPTTSSPATKTCWSSKNTTRPKS